MKEIEAVLTVQLTAIYRVKDEQAEAIERNRDAKFDRFLEALKREHGLDDVLLIDKKFFVKDLG